MRQRVPLGFGVRVLAGALAVGMLATAPAAADPTIKTPADVLLGNRFLDETRFAQFFFAHVGPNVNEPLAHGDPVMDVTATTGTPLPGPFAGQSISCRACHLDVQQKGVPGGGSRTYTDFARRSPIPDRGDGQVLTVRNSQPLFNASLARDSFFLHFDGEFTSGEDLSMATLTGRNFGWLPGERAQAIAHIARVVRDDDGSDALAQKFGGGSYRSILLGTANLEPANRPIPQPLRVDVMLLGDEEVVYVVARFLDVYMRSLVGAQDADGAFTGSPYDVFLRKNGLPTQPQRRETQNAYARRLRHLVEKLRAPAFVSEADGHFTLHDQPFVFGAVELAGLRVFLRAPRGRVRPADLERGGVGNCATCHPPPTFTDFRFHNTGAAQDEYDGIHGAGSFAALAVPDLATRNADVDAYLPPTTAHPDANGRFRAVPAAGHPGLTDLGLWNLYGHPDFPNVQQQQARGRAICLSRRSTGCGRGTVGSARLLEQAIALFKTPGLRDLSHSGPYLHTGAKDTLEDVIGFYRTSSALAREGRMRNAPPALARIALTPGDTTPLAAFLRALDEDFQ